MGCPVRLTRPQAHQLQVQFLGPLQYLPGASRNACSRQRGGLSKIAVQLPGRAKVGGEAEMGRVFALRRPQHFNARGHVAETDVRHRGRRLRRR